MSYYTATIINRQSEGMAIKVIFGFLRSSAKITFPEFWKKDDTTTQVEKFDEESF